MRGYTICPVIHCMALSLATWLRQCPFNQSLFDLVKAGRVTEKEAMSKASNPQALEMNFKGIFLDEGRRIISS